MTISTEKAIHRFSVRRRSMKFRFQYRKNQISVFGNYEKIEQNSKFSENEKYQPRSKKSNAGQKGEVSFNAGQKSEFEAISKETKNSFASSKFENSLNLKSELAFSSHAKQKSLIRNRISILSSNKKRTVSFSKKSFVQTEREKPSKKKIRSISKQN